MYSLLLRISLYAHLASLTVFLALFLLYEVVWLVLNIIKTGLNQGSCVSS